MELELEKKNTAQKLVSINSLIDRNNCPDYWVSYSILSTPVEME
jgi:hypothetical protein